MQVVANYYSSKAKITGLDHFYERVEQRDISILRKAFAYILIAPFLSTAVMYAAKEMKQDYTFSSNFFFGAMSALRPSSYTSSGAAVTGMQPTPLAPEEESKKESQKLKHLYQALKEEENTDLLERQAKLRKFSSTLRSKNAKSRTQQRIINSSPFNKNQQGKRFGIDGASIITDSKEQRQNRSD